MQLGVDIFRKAFLIVWTNLYDAWRVSAVIYIVQSLFVAALTVALTGQLTPANLPVANPEKMAAGTGVLAIGILASSLIGFSWIAVGWHRYVLAEELPTGMIPAWSTDRVMSYIWKSIMLGFLMVGIGLLPAMAVGMIGQIAPSLTGIGFLGLMIFVIWASSRLAIVLPAQSIDQPMTFSQAWQKTAPVSAGIFMAAILTMGVFGLGGQVINSVLPQNVIGTVVNLAFQWVATMVGIGLLTTIYGVAVEGRSLR